MRLAIPVKLKLFLRFADYPREATATALTFFDYAYLPLRFRKNFN